jgi:hypothetical protein
MDVVIVYILGMVCIDRIDPESKVCSVLFCSCETSIMTTWCIARGSPLLFFIISRFC